MERHRKSTPLVLIFGLTLTLSACQKGSSPNNPGSLQGNDSTPTLSGPKHGELIRAAAEGDLKLVLTLLKEGANPNESIVSGGNKFTPLFVSILRKHEDISETLLRHGAKDFGRYLGYTGRDFALYLNQDDTVNLMDSNHQ